MSKLLFLHLVTKISWRTFSHGNQFWKILQVQKDAHQCAILRSPFTAKVNVKINLLQKKNSKKRNTYSGARLPAKPLLTAITSSTVSTPLLYSYYSESLQEYALRVILLFEPKAKSSALRVIPAETRELKL